MANFDFVGLNRAIAQVASDRPELFGQATTGALEGARRGQQFLRPSDDLQALEFFGLNEQSGAQLGRSQEGVLEGLSNRVGAETRAAEARARASSRADVDAASFERATRGRGLSERQRRSATRRLGLSRALAVASRGSESRRTSTDLAIASRKAGTQLEEGVFGQELAGLSALANAEGQRAVRAAQEGAQRRSERNSLIGTVVGLGATILPLLFSSESIKDTKRPATKILDKLRKVRVEKWRYKGEDQDHIGPYAEEFNDTFETGQRHRGLINVIDALGVTLGAVKELDAKVRASGS